MDFGIESLLFFVSSFEAAFWRIIFHSEFAFSVFILLARNGRAYVMCLPLGGMNTYALLRAGFPFVLPEFRKRAKECHFFLILERAEFALLGSKSNSWKITDFGFLLVIPVLMLEAKFRRKTWILIHSSSRIPEQIWFPSYLPETSQISILIKPIIASSLPFIRFLKSGISILILQSR